MPARNNGNNNQGNNNQRNGSNNQNGNSNQNGYNSQNGNSNNTQRTNQNGNNNQRNGTNNQRQTTVQQVDQPKTQPVFAQTLGEFNTNRGAAPAPVSQAPAPSAPKKGSSGSMSTLLWFLVVILVICGFGLLFMVMRGKFKSIENELIALDDEPVDDEPLKRDVQRLRTAVDNLKEDVDESYENIRYVRKMFEEKGAKVRDDLAELTSGALNSLKRELDEVKEDRDVDLRAIVDDLADAKSYDISKSAEGLTMVSDPSADTAWVLKRDGLMHRVGDETRTFSFDDEWIRVCNGTNCSEIKLAKRESVGEDTAGEGDVVPDTAHDVPRKASDVLTLMESIQVPRLKEQADIDT